MKNFKGSKPANVKHRNQKAVLQLFKHHETLSITEASKITGLSKTTVIKIFDYFLNRNIIISTGKGDSTASGGKKPELFELNSKFGYALSIHILKHKLMLAITDTKGNMIITRIIPVNFDEPSEKVINIIADFINSTVSKDVYKERKLLGISIGAQGVTDSEKGEILTASNYPSWEYKTPFIRILKEKTSDEYVFSIDNQIRLICLAEHMKGKARDTANFMVLKAGTDGVGSGIMIGGRLFKGHNYLAGEIGHMKLDMDSNDLCHCGGTGCFESLVAFDRILEKAKAVYKEYDNTSDTDELQIQDIFNDSNTGHPAAMKVMDDLAYIYAVGISNGCLMIDPEMIIITGGIVDAGEFFIGRVRDKISGISLTRMKKDYNIQYTSFYKNGSLIGGAINIIDNYFNNYFSEENQ